MPVILCIGKYHSDVYCVCGVYMILIDILTIISIL